MKLPNNTPCESKEDNIPKGEGARLPSDSLFLRLPGFSVGDSLLEQTLAHLAGGGLPEAFPDGRPLPWSAMKTGDVAGGRWRLLRSLGAGSRCVVFLARDEKIGLLLDGHRTVAPEEAARELRNRLEEANGLEWVLPVFDARDIVSGERLLSMENGLLSLVVAEEPGDFPKTLKSRRERRAWGELAVRAERVDACPPLPGRTDPLERAALHLARSCRLLVFSSGGAAEEAARKAAREARASGEPLLLPLSDPPFFADLSGPEPFRTLQRRQGDSPMYDPRPLDLSHIELSDDLVELTELLAENAHDVWARGRMREGWRYGPRRDDEAREHPCLRPYADLPSSEKAYDREMAMNTLKAVAALGYRIEKKE